jgi:hypothetical protein
MKPEQRIMPSWIKSEACGKSLDMYSQSHHLHLKVVPPGKAITLYKGIAPTIFNL